MLQVACFHVPLVSRKRNRTQIVCDANVHNDVSHSHATHVVRVFLWRERNWVEGTLLSYHQQGINHLQGLAIYVTTRQSMWENSLKCGSVPSLTLRMRLTLKHFKTSKSKTGKREKPIFKYWQRKRFISTMDRFIISPLTTLSNLGSKA